MKKTICLLMSAICLAFLISCGGNNIETADEKIETADDWIALCSSTSDVKVIDKAFLEIKSDNAIQIFEDLLRDMGAEPLRKERSKAMVYMWAASLHHYNDYFTSGQQVRFRILIEDKGFAYALMIASVDMNCSAEHLAEICREFVELDI